MTIHKTFIPNLNLIAVFILVLHLENINQNSRSSESKLLLSSCSIRKDYVECITLSTALVHQSGPELCHLRIFLSTVALQWIQGLRVPDNVRKTTTFSFGSTTTTLDAHACNTRVGSEAILLLPVCLKDIILGNKDTTITHKLRLADDVTIAILRDNERLETAAAHTACQGLLMRRDDILVTIFLSEALGGLVTLGPAPIVVLFNFNGFRNGRRVLHILGLPAIRQTAPHKPRRFLMNPCSVGQVVGVASVKVVGLADYPVD
mmetsp:Transcript_13227/g.16095  ORF Transcript_13227/g.16095 Transcript_13227/m.16095 type:complete len:262 (+) Transcript_13227:1335-2120(+)